jgi:signal transduction histidine kinase
MGIYRFYCILFGVFLFCGGKAKAQLPSSHRDSLLQVLQTKPLTDLERVSTLFGMGLYYNAISEYDSSRVYLEQALDLPGGREFEGGRIITNLGNSYGFQGRYAEALKYYLQAIDVGMRDRKMRFGRINIVRSMGNAAEIYYLLGNQNQALHYANRANTAIEELNKEYPPIDRGYLYLSPQIQYIAGSVYLDRGETDKAEAYMKRTFEIADSMVEISLRKGLSNGLFLYCAYGKEGLACVCLSQKEYGKALDYAAEALSFAEKNKDPMGIAKVWHTFSNIYLAQNRYEESGKCARKAMKFYPEIVKLNPGVLYNLAIAHLFAGNEEQSCEFFHAYSQQMKENTDKNFRETMASMEIQFEIENKDTRIAHLEQQKILYTCIGIAAVVLAIAIWIILAQKIKDERKEKQLIAANAVIEGGKRERQRIARNLHDSINGMLSAIRIELSTEEHLQGVCSRIDGCIEEIRRLASGVMPLALQRYGLKATLDDYCRSFPNVHFYFFGEDGRIDGKIELAVYYCAYELICNSIRHSGATSIDVQLIQGGDRVSLSVQDNGCGFNPELSKRGVGLKNIRDRLITFNGQLDINTSPGKGTETTIEIQYKKEIT